MMLSIATNTLLQQHVLDYSSNVSTNILIYCGSYTSGLISHVTVVVLGVRTLDLLARYAPEQLVAFISVQYAQYIQHNVTRKRLITYWFAFQVVNLSSR